MTGLLGLDLGTSSIKGAVVTSTGDIIAKSTKDIELIKPDSIRVEVDPKKYRASVFSVIQKLHQKSASEKVQIKALAMAAASGNSLLTSSNGQAKTPVISWMDQRMARDRKNHFPHLKDDKIYRIAGWPWNGLFSLAHFKWFLEHQKKAITDDTRFAMNNDWIYQQLTGKWIVDPSTATTSLLFDQKKGKWSPYLLEQLGIRTNRLSDLASCGTSIGTITSAAAAETGLDPETIAVTGCFDHPGAARGVGILDPGEVLFSCGTSWVGFYPLPDRGTGLKAGMLVDPFRSPRGPWAGMTSLPMMGTTINRIVESRFPGETLQDKFRSLNEMFLQGTPRSGTTLIDPMDDTTSDPVFIKAETERRGLAWLSDSLMRGSAYAMKRNNSDLRDLGIRSDRFVMAGGPAESPVWPQIIADVLEKPVQLAAGKYAGAAGAAVLAGMGIGLFRDEYHAREIFGSAMLDQKLKPRGELRDFHRREYAPFLKKGR